MKIQIPYNKIIKDLSEEKDDRLIGLQLPEGLIWRSSEIINKLEDKTDKRFVLSGEPCYGACDIPLDRMKRINVDTIVHIGHSKLLPSNQLNDIKVNYYPIKFSLSNKNLLEDATDKLNGTKIGLVGTIHYIDSLRSIKAFLEKNGFNVVLEEGDYRISELGQILGCNYSAAPEDVEEYLYIGGGRFHPIGLSFSKNKRVVIIDPEKEEVRVTEDYDEFIKKRMLYVEKASNANEVGVILVTKIGQTRYNEALKIKKACREKDIKCTLITLDTISPSKLDRFDLDVFVNTGCPRLTYDDSDRFNQLILTPGEFRVAFLSEDFNDIYFDEIRE
ncbi:MAG: Diphthamide synthase subunit DPH2 [Candidatus Methanohalarchaeum thermophilum]|uniref:2-(3-amino-3-carboxypropyl)histidine synthase n=1 Tax=Methanohalarchaeum thermophilum TaxID=1903181 RepID=A0A1Q6DXY5_METT1|nr:MAG: Diphthamide synthase subunit DPH2 [Candidatus Methanohalarchaeum thermophilum]